MTRPLRFPMLIVLSVLVVVGLFVQAGRNEDTTAATDAVRLSGLTPTAAAAGTLSSTWYCAAGSATGDTTGPAEQMVIVVNASDATSTGTVSAVSDTGASVSVPITVPAHGRQQVTVSDHLKAPWASALVETSGGEVTVAHQLTGPAGRSVSTCASRPSASWYFPAGTTRVGATYRLALFNPFPGEATVDLSFSTFTEDDGPSSRTPQSFQGLVVPGGRVTVVEVDPVVTLGERVSATVSARSGRVVAEQLQTTDGRATNDERPSTDKGLSSVIGATTAAPVWTFPMGAPAGVDARELVSVFNPGDDTAMVSIQVQLDDPEINGTVEPFELSVPAHRDAVADLAADDRVPPGVGHWILARTSDGSNVVVARTIAGDDTSPARTVAMGLPVVATRWLVPVAGVADLASTQLAVANPSATDTATVTVGTRAAGTTGDEAQTAGITIAPGDREILDLAPSGAGASVEVTSDSPVAVSQWMAFAVPADVASPIAVPVVGTQSLPDDVIGPQVIDQALDPILPPPDDTIADSVPVDPTEPDAEATTTSLATDATSITTTPTTTAGATSSTAPG